MSKPIRSVLSAGFLALALVGVAVPAGAQQAPQALNTQFTPSHIEIAAEVLRASGLTQVFQNTAPNVVGNLRVNMTRQRPELTKDIEESLKVVETETTRLANDGVIAAARFLAVKLTEPELKEIGAFLNSAVGKKYVETLPAFMEQVVPFLEAWNQELSQKLIKTFQDEMARRGHRI